MKKWLLTALLIITSLAFGKEVASPINETTTLDPGTNPTRFSAGSYVNSDGTLAGVVEQITNSPDSYFDVPAHKQALLNQAEAVEILLGTNASNTAVIAKIDAMKSDVGKWVIHEQTRTALESDIETLKACVWVQRKVK